MATSGRGSGMVAYNVQSAVDTTNHLIVAHEVTNVGTDRSQLATMAQAAKAALRSDNLDVVADRGYFKGEEILACERAGVPVTLPKPQTSGAKSAGRFGKPDFVYLAKDDAKRVLGEFDGVAVVEDRRRQRDHAGIRLHFLVAPHGDVDRDRTVVARRVVERQRFVADRPFACGEIRDSHQCRKRNQNSNSTFHVRPRRTRPSLRDSAESTFPPVKGYRRRYARRD
jgi:hypothetical protein